MSDLGAAALRAAERGFHVFRIVERTKRALDPRGFHGATCDPAEVVRRWRERPEANIGVALAPSALIVLDLDDHGRPGEADDSLRGIEAREGPLPRTACVRTPSGGRHFWFRRPLDAALRTVTGFAPSLDVLADQVTAPPSVRPEGAYVWTCGGPIAAAPEWLLRAAARPAPAPPPAAPVVVRSTSAWARTVLRNAADRIAAASTGTRDATLSREAYGLGGYVGGGALDGNETADVLIAAGEAAGLPAAAVRACVLRGLRRGMAAPRRVALRSAGGAA